MNFREVLDGFDAEHVGRNSAAHFREPRGKAVQHTPLLHPTTWDDYFPMTDRQAL